MPDYCTMNFRYTIYGRLLADNTTIKTRTDFSTVFSEENTGILYGANDAFSVLAVLDGTVTNIKDDEFLGKVIEIKHSNNLSTFYYSLENIKVNVNDQVKAGDEIATSGTNKINNEGTSLLFEVYYKGKTMDPEEFYKTDANTLNKD